MVVDKEVREKIREGIKKMLMDAYGGTKLNYWINEELGMLPNEDEKGYAVEVMNKVMKCLREYEDAV